MASAPNFTSTDGLRGRVLYAALVHNQRAWIRYCEANGVSYAGPNGFNIRQADADELIRLEARLKSYGPPRGLEWEADGACGLVARDGQFCALIRARNHVGPCWVWGQLTVEVDGGVLVMEVKRLAAETVPTGWIMDEVKAELERKIPIIARCVRELGVPHAG